MAEYCHIYKALLYDFYFQGFTILIDKPKEKVLTCWLVHQYFNPILSNSIKCQHHFSHTPFIFLCMTKNTQLFQRGKKMCVVFHTCMILQKKKCHFSLEAKILHRSSTFLSSFPEKPISQEEIQYSPRIQSKKKKSISKKHIMHESFLFKMTAIIFCH